MMNQFSELAQRAVQYARETTQFGPAIPTAAQRAQQMLSEHGRAVAHRGDVNINVKIEQTLHDADDPERVYIATTRALNDALIRPKSSVHGLVLR